MDLAFRCSDGAVSDRLFPVWILCCLAVGGTCLFYSGTKDILPLITHFRGVFTSDPYFIPFQLIRGALWTALAVLIVSMMKGKRWELALAVALVFAGLLSSGVGLFPNPFMPPMVRQSHFYEILSSMLLFGGVAGSDSVSQEKAGRARANHQPRPKLEHQCRGRDDHHLARGTGDEIMVAAPGR